MFLGLYVSVGSGKSVSLRDETTGMNEQEIFDEVLGMIRLRRHPRARRYTLRVENGQVIGTLPVRGSEREMLAFISQHRTKLQELLTRNTTRRFDEQTDWQTSTFHLRIFRCPRTSFYMTLKEGILHLACPEATDFGSEPVQKILRAMIGRALRHEALRVLPKRLAALAARYGFSYTRVTVRDMRTRWGSCSSERRISLALSLMTLPEHLIDYVLLHELCHTVEMNHSQQFWLLMNRVTDGQAQKLRRDLRKQSVW
ncbi:WLM domain protein [Tannerella forsythia]|nr:WLM domain protein [Tannerella forsythia]